MSESAEAATCQAPLPESQGQNLALTALYVRHSFDSGVLRVKRQHPTLTRTRQSRRESGLGFQVKVLRFFKPLSLRVVRVGVPHRPLLPSLPTVDGGGRR